MNGPTMMTVVRPPAGLGTDITSLLMQYCQVLPRGNLPIIVGFLKSSLMSLFMNLAELHPRVLVPPSPSLCCPVPNLSPPLVF